MTASSKAPNEAGTSISQIPRWRDRGPVSQSHKMEREDRMQIQAWSTPSQAGGAASANSRQPWGHGSSCVIRWRREDQAASHCQVQRAACARLGQRSEEPHSPNPRPSEHCFEQQAMGCDQSPKLNGVPVHCSEGSDRRAPLTKPPRPMA